MINANGNTYLTYLFDTNFLSEILEDEVFFGSSVLNFILPKGVIVVHPASIWEIASKPVLFEKFKNTFLSLPTILLFDHNYIIQKEIQHYYQETMPSLTEIALFLNARHFESGGYDLAKIIESHVQRSTVENYVSSQRDLFTEIKNGDLAGFMAGNDHRIKSDIRRSVDLLAFQKVATTNPEFIENVHSSGRAVDITKFQSALCDSFLYHYKFHFPRRKGEPSDLSDILIGSALPYVDGFLTERGMATMLRELKEAHGFLPRLKVYTFADFATDV